MNNLITVIVPVYNVEKYLPRCIESIINQTYKNLQIILVDDGSTDNCGAICDNYAKRDSRISVIHKINGGLSDARNAGLEKMQGEYVTFIDSDDYVNTDFIKALLDALKNQNADIAIGNTVIFSDGQMPKDNCDSELCKTYTSEQAVEVMLLQREFDNSAGGKLYIADLFKENRFTFGVLYEDFDIIYDIVFSVQKIVHTTKARYFYYQNALGIMHQRIDERHFVLIDFAKRLLKQISEKHPTLIKQAYSRYVFSNFFILDRITFNKSQKKYKTTVDSIRHNIKSEKENIFKNPYITALVKVKALSLIIGYNAYRLLLLAFKKIKG